MATFAVFATGFFVGATRGVFSLLISGIVVAVATFASSISEGIIWACVRCLEWVLIVNFGFIVAAVVSVLAPNILSLHRPTLRGGTPRRAETTPTVDASRPRG
jgi:hypothetical protein